MKTHHCGMLGLLAALAMVLPSAAIQFSWELEASLDYFYCLQQQGAWQQWQQQAKYLYYYHKYHHPIPNRKSST